MPQLPAALKKLLNKDKRSKYGNHKVCCLSKHTHDSKLEANYCNRLLAMKQKGEVQSYIIQKSFDLEIQGILICRHIVDFYITFDDADGFLRQECHDTKGVKTADWVIKRKMFQALYPNVQYKVITAH